MPVWGQERGIEEWDWKLGGVKKVQVGMEMKVRCSGEDRAGCGSGCRRGHKEEGFFRTGRGRAGGPGWRQG